jgi:hypothetical protein
MYAKNANLTIWNRANALVGSGDVVGARLAAQQSCTASCIEEEVLAFCNVLHVDLRSAIDFCQDTEMTTVSGYFHIQQIRQLHTLMASKAASNTAD